MTQLLKLNRDIHYWEVLGTEDLNYDILVTYLCVKRRIHSQLN